MLRILGNAESSYVYDKILLEAPVEGAEEVALILKITMEEAGGALLKIPPVVGKVVIANSWAEK
jgi:DNA polymerase I-like protein with 3'-5' exonuclease and polymerase domains